MKLVAIVEGHGDEQAVPVLLRRILGERGRYDVHVERPLRVPKTKLLQEGELERIAAIACRFQPDPRILVLIDADRDCPATLGPRLLGRMRASGVRVCEVVLAVTEFESWFLAAAESLAGYRGLPRDLSAPTDPEGRRDAKGWLALHRGGYSETIDQSKFAAKFDLDLAQQRAPSFAKLTRALDRLISPGPMEYSGQ